MDKYILIIILGVFVIGLSFLFGKSVANTSFLKKKQEDEGKSDEFIAKNRSDIANMSDDSINDELYYGKH